MQRIIDHFTANLNVLSQLLDKAEQHVDSSDLSADELLHARLADDMLPFIKQIQLASDTAKFSVARLSDSLDDVPKDEDNEETFDGLRERLARTVAYIEGFSEADFEGFETLHITLPFAKGLYMDGIDYLHQFALPNFYFHVVTAYGLLRSHGVEIGKRDFLSYVQMKPIE